MVVPSCSPSAVPLCLPSSLAFGHQIFADSPAGSSIGDVIDKYNWPPESLSTVNERTLRASPVPAFKPLISCVDGVPFDVASAFSISIKQLPYVGGQHTQVAVALSVAHGTSTVLSDSETTDGSTAIESASLPIEDDEGLSTSDVVCFPSPSTPSHGDLPDNPMASQAEIDISIAAASTDASVASECTNEALVDSETDDLEVGLSRGGGANTANSLSNELRKLLESAFDGVSGVVKRAIHAIKSWKERLLGDRQWGCGCPV